LKALLDNLPNAIVKELKIRYATNELFAGTYGRGVWRTKLYQQVDDLAVHDIAAAPRIIIYPNPVNDALIIETSDGMKGDAITISTTTGQQSNNSRQTRRKCPSPAPNPGTGHLLRLLRGGHCEDSEEVCETVKSTVLSVIFDYLISILCAFFDEL
jgi:hypothetical protein